MLAKHKQVSEGGCGYSKWAPEQPGLSWPCRARGPPGLPSNPSYSLSPWNHPLGRICKCRIPDMNVNNLHHQLLVYFDFMWDCYKSGDSFSFSHFRSLECHSPNRLKLWTPAMFQLLQVTPKSSPPCQTKWPHRTSLLLLRTSQCRFWKSQMFQRTLRWDLRLK